MRWRYLPFYLLLIFSFWFLTIRLIDLTVVRGGYFRDLSEGNRIQEKFIRAPRGIIYDRHHQVLVRNTPVYKKCDAGNKAGAISNCQVISREEALEMETQGGTEAGRLITDLKREYPWGGVLAHVLGYIGEVNDKELGDKNLKSLDYKMGDLKGRTGIEEQYEEILRGIDGKELIEVDAAGSKLKTLGKIEPVVGQALDLTIDLDLQKVAAQALEGKTGAVVVSQPQTGEILALYSSPTFDPNEISQKTLEDWQKPMFDRSISGLYPPGSIFKIITATAGLETGKINKETQVEDTGVITIGPYQYPNWFWLQYGKTDGLLNIVTALKRSNDIYFYKVGEWVGVKKLAEWAGKMGVGKILGIDLPGEVAGVMPTPEWRQKTRGDEWYLGDTYHLAIGQGDLQVTPLQANSWTNVIANGGKLCRPTLVKNQDCKDLGLKKETISLIKEGMREACSTGGTGWPLFDFKVKDKQIETACKTGTAEYGDPQNKTHAWFTVFAPVPASDSGNQHIKVDQELPEISVTVLVEGGGEGSNVAAPIAKKILEEWFGR